MHFFIPCSSTHLLAAAEQPKNSGRELHKQPEHIHPANPQRVDICFIAAFKNLAINRIRGLVGSGAFGEDMLMKTVGGEDVWVQRFFLSPLSKNEMFSVLNDALFISSQ